ncbi:MAG TPA: hypothetical protein VHA74_02190 [Candidatus Dojkabacteria bacterium]|nr:hypothetical protein [Candidatus Dojkabacteria bacterium]
MKIFFTASFYGKKQYQKQYDLVLKTIQKYEKDIISPELGNYLKVLNDKQKLKLKNLRTIHYHAIRKDISQADVVIIEISYQDFQLGHEATLAIQSKKPVLCLSIHEDMSEKVKDPLFKGAKYNHSNLDSIIKKFLKDAQKSILNQRFNLFLSPAQEEYLNKVSKEKKLTKSAYIRSLIDQDRK